MRWERDQVGVSVFVELAPSFDAVVSATVPPSVLLFFGALATGCGLTWVGPALLFVGLALWITVPMSLQPGPEIIQTLRIDHRGIRVDQQPLGPEVQPIANERGVQLGTRFLPIADPVERNELLTLLRRAQSPLRSGEVPPQLRAMRDRA